MVPGIFEADEGAFPSPPCRLRWIRVFSAAEPSGAGPVRERGFLQLFAATFPDLLFEVVPIFPCGAPQRELAVRLVELSGPDEFLLLGLIIEVWKER